MRLGIFRRFSHLIHRRTRSDSAIIIQTSNVVSSSISADNLTTRVVDLVLPPAPALSPLILSRNSPLVDTEALVFDNLPAPNSPPFTRADNDTLLRLSAAQKQASDLATHSTHLKASIQALQARELHVEGAARKAKNDLERVRSLVNRQKRRSVELESQINAKKQELAQCQAFAEAINQAGLLSFVNSDRRNQEDLEEIAVEAIREASSDSTGTWSKIVSFIIGPRAPENYVNTINMTLQTRQEIRYWNKVSNFWKKAAREGKTNEGAPTPSSSNLSELQETLSEERKRAVEALREKRKILGLNPSTSNESVALSYRSPDSHPSFTSVMSNISIMDSSRENSNAELASRLPPLASDLFKQELISSHSSQRLFSSQNRKIARSSSHETASSRLSEKALGKRRVVENHGSMVKLCKLWKLFLNLTDSIGFKPSVNSLSCDSSSGQISRMVRPASFSTSFYLTKCPLG